MSSSRPGTAREALVAELIGDVQLLLERVEKADVSTRATVQALASATASYQGQVDEMTARLRSETARIITQTTEHAAKSLVGQQAATLQQAATEAMQRALTTQLLRRSRLDWLMAAAVGGACGVATAGLLCVLVMR